MVCGPPGKRGLFAPYLVLVGLKLDSVNVIVRLQSMTAYHAMARTLIAKNVTTILVQSTDSGLSGYHGNHVLRHVVEAHATGIGRVIILRLRTAVLIVRTLTVIYPRVLNHHVQVGCMFHTCIPPFHYICIILGLLCMSTRCLPLIPCIYNYLYLFEIIRIACTLVYYHGIKRQQNKVSFDTTLLFCHL